MTAPHLWFGPNIEPLPFTSGIVHPFPNIAVEANVATVQRAMLAHVRRAVINEFGRAVLYNHIVGAVLEHITINKFDACIAGGMAVWLGHHSHLIAVPHIGPMCPWWPHDIDIFVSDERTERELLEYFKHFYGATRIGPEQSSDTMDGFDFTEPPVDEATFSNMQQRSVYNLLLATLKRCQFPSSDIPIEVATVPRLCRLLTASRYA